VAQAYNRSVICEASSISVRNSDVSSFEAFMAAMFQVVFWVLTPCGVVVRYQRFRGPFCLFLQGEDGELCYAFT